MEMVEGSDEDSRCAAAKSVLSEMISNMTTVEEKDVFDVEDSMEDLREGSIGEVDAPLSPCVADRTALVLQQEGQEAEDKSIHAHTHTHTHTRNTHTHAHTERQPHRDDHAHVTKLVWLCFLL